MLFFSKCVLVKYVTLTLFNKKRAISFLGKKSTLSFSHPGSKRGSKSKFYASNYNSNFVSIKLFALNQLNCKWVFVLNLIHDVD